jgi:hypothetical protein
MAGVLIFYSFLLFGALTLPNLISVDSSPSPKAYSGTNFPGM